MPMPMLMLPMIEMIATAISSSIRVNPKRCCCSRITTQMTQTSDWVCTFQADSLSYKMIIPNVARKAEFAAAKMGKTTLAQGDHLFAGLNCFEPGQDHAPHVHADQDKFYYVVEGSGEIRVGGQTEMLNS